VLGLTENVANAAEALRVLVAEAPVLPVPPHEKLPAKTGARLHWAEETSDEEIIGGSLLAGSQNLGAVLTDMPQEATPDPPLAPPLPAEVPTKTALVGQVSGPTHSDASTAGGHGGGSSCDSSGCGEMKITAAEGPQKPWGGKKDRGGNRRERQRWQSSCHIGACPTCGTGRFCPCCGMALWQHDVMNQAGYGPYCMQGTWKQEARSSASTCYPGTPDSEAAVPWMQWVPFDGSFAQSQQLQDQTQDQPQDQPQKEEQQHKNNDHWQQQPQQQPVQQGGGALQGRLVPAYFSHNLVPQGMVPVCFAASGPLPSVMQYAQGGKTEEV